MTTSLFISRLMGWCWYLTTIAQIIYDDWTLTANGLVALVVATLWHCSYTILKYLEDLEGQR
jgi:hypothetical protein